MLTPLGFMFVLSLLSNTKLLSNSLSFDARELFKRDLLLKNHCMYTNIFSFVVLLLFSFLAVYPEGIEIPFIGFTSIFWVILIALCILHLCNVLILYRLKNR